MRAAAFHCPHCDQAYTLSDEQAPQYAGQRIACTNCGVAFTVPESVWRASNVTSQPTRTPSDPPASTPIPTVLAPQPRPPQQVVGQPPTYGASPHDRARLIPPPLPDPSQQQPPTSGMAIGSLISALLGIVVPIVPSLLAMGLGVGAWIRAREGRAGGRGIAVAAFIVGLVGLVIHTLVIAMVVVPHFRLARSVTNSDRCAEHLRATGNALLAYAADNAGRFPDGIEQLAATRGFDSEQLYCPTATGTTRSYVYAGAGLTTASQPECVLMYEPLDHHDWRGVNVLFVDGRVSFIGEIEAGRAIPRLKKGKNPPWTFTGN